MANVRRRYQASPVIKERKEFVQYGISRIERTFAACPRCKRTLNAGPNYMPSHCDKCGQKLSFKGFVWDDDKWLGYVSREEKEVVFDEPIRDRVV